MPLGPMDEERPFVTIETPQHTMPTIKNVDRGRPNAGNHAQSHVLTYKPEIDGLRSVAVLSVLIFHLGFPYLPGGFTGVDIFFVISGYLITQIIAGDMQAGRFSLLDFYRRRALRILPPLFALLLFVSLAAWVVFLPTEMSDFGQSISWTAMFSSNIYFFKEINYFNPEAKFNPLLHTWSLGVEEQFYIVVPVILWLLFRFARRNVKPFFSATVLASFILSAVLVFFSQKATFYLLPTRYWEMGVGSILALYGLHGRLNGRLADIVSAVGLSLLAASLMLVDEASRFPGPAALPATIGAALIILTGANGFVGRLLATPGPVFVGRVSYSLYLWHWPLIVFYRLWVAPDITLLAGIGIGLLSFACAVLSFRFVETPLRRLPQRFSNMNVLGTSVGCLAGLLAFGILLPQVSGALRSFPDDVNHLASYDRYDEGTASKAQYRKDQCFITSGTKGGIDAFDENVCLARDAAKPDYLLIGDSQAADLWQSLQEARRDINLMQATASGCKPTISTAGEPRCVKLMNEIYRELLPQHPVDSVVLSARWQTEDMAGLVSTIRELHRLGVPRIIVLGPRVEYSQSFPLILARDALKGSDDTAEFRVDTRRDLDRSMAASLGDKNVIYLSLYDAVCPKDQCVETVENTPVQSDYGHFTDIGARLVSRRLGSEL